MPPTDFAQSAYPSTAPSESNSRAESSNAETSSEVEVVKESGLYRFVEIEKGACHNGSNEDSPPPSVQSAAELYSRSLNDVSSLMNERIDKDGDSQSEILYMHKPREPQSQPLTPPGLRDRLLKKIRPKRLWETSHAHAQDCPANVAASVGAVGQLRRRDRDSTQIHTSSDDEDAESRYDTAKRHRSSNQENQPSTEASDTNSGV